MHSCCVAVADTRVGLQLCNSFTRTMLRLPYDFLPRPTFSRKLVESETTHNHHVNNIENFFECNSRCGTSPCKTVLFSSKLRKLLTFLIICFLTQIQIKLPLSLAEATSTFKFATVFVELKSSSIVMLAIVVDCSLTALPEPGDNLALGSGFEFGRVVHSRIVKDT